MVSGSECEQFERKITSLQEEIELLKEKLKAIERYYRTVLILVSDAFVKNNLIAWVPTAIRLPRNDICRFNSLNFC